jgi:hypothetical protein
MAHCTHGNGKMLCFECFKAGMERTRARRAAWEQKSLPFDLTVEPERPLTERQLAHRRQMLEYLRSQSA